MPSEFEINRRLLELDEENTALRTKLMKAQVGRLRDRRLYDEMKEVFRKQIGFLNGELEKGKNSKE